MVQIIEKMVVTPDLTTQKATINYYVKDQVTGLTSVKTYVSANLADHDTPLKVGNLLVGTYSAIDLPHA